MARVQSQQIIDALEQMRGLNGQTDSLLEIIQAQQATNTEAIRQMQTATNLIRRLMQGRQDMEDILNAVGRHGEDMNQNIERIREALNGQPTVQQMQSAIQELEEAQNMALQGGLPAPPPAQPSSGLSAAAAPSSGLSAAAVPSSGLNAAAAPFVPNPNPSVSGGYNWRNSAKKTKSKTKKRKGGYKSRSAVKKTKASTRSKKRQSLSRRSSKK